MNEMKHVWTKLGRYERSGAHMNETEEMETNWRKIERTKEESMIFSFPAGKTIVGYGSEGDGTNIDLSLKSMVT